MQEIVRKHRFRKIMKEYKNNYYHNEPLYLKSKYKHCGFTTLVIIDSLLRDIPIYVPTMCEKSKLLAKMVDISNSELIDNKHPLVLSRDYVIAKPELNYYKHKNIPYILVDDSCTIMDLIELKSESPSTKIYNGGIYHENETVMKEGDHYEYFIGK